MEPFLKRVTQAQNELKAPKGQYNKFGKFNYRSAEDILEAVKPINEKYGLNLTISDEPVQIGDRTYMKSTCTLKDVESESTPIVVTGFAREAANKKGMDESQITGTASSYACKYALKGLYLIDDTKDADTDAYQEQRNNAPNQVDEQLRERIKSGYEALGKITKKTRPKLIEEVVKRSNVSKIADLNDQEHMNILEVFYKQELKKAQDKESNQEAEQGNFMQGNTTQPTNQVNWGQK